jgi:predicted nucleic acid-binding protein
VKYFIDTNVIIDLLKNKDEAKEQLNALLIQEDSELFINRLVLIESLRTIRFDNKKIFREAQATLERFEQVNIKQEIYDEAIAFSRYCHSKGITLKGKCEAIDFLHFITAKHYELILITNDKDFEGLETKYSDYEKYITKGNPKLNVTTR